MLQAIQLYYRFKDYFLSQIVLIMV